MRLCSSRKEYIRYLEIECARGEELNQDGSMGSGAGSEGSDRLGSAESSSSGVADSAPRRRRISAPAGHALEILGHAIEYLADEYVHEGGELRADDPRLEAIQLLMAVNRQIYLECPLERSFAERCLSWLHLRAA